MKLERSLELIKKVEIKGLKSVDEISLDCKNLNLLVGTNSSGKSTILQAILLLAENLEKPCGLNGSLISLGEFEEVRCWNSKQRKVEVTLLTDQGTTCWSIYEEEETLAMDIFPIEPQLLVFREQFDFHSGRLSYLSCNRIGARDVYEKNLVSTQEIGINGEYAIDYLRIRKDTPVSEEICKFKELITLSNQVNGWLHYIIGANIRVENIIGTDVVKAAYKVGNQKETRPKNVGSGVSYLISILVLCLSSKKDNIIIIENPEIHLHPLAQSKVCEFLYYIASNERQIFIETHSDHLFNAIRVGIATNAMTSDKVQVNFVSLDEESCTKNTVVEFGKRGRVVNPQKDLFDQFDNDLNRMLGI